MEQKLRTNNSQSVIGRGKLKLNKENIKQKDKLTLKALSKVTNEENEKTQYSSTIQTNRQNLYINETYTPSNFLKEMNNVYDIDKENLINQLLVYQQELESRRSLIEDQQKIYQNKLKEIENKYKTDYELLQNKYENQTNQLINEKDEQINVLIENNKELMKCNEDLFEKNNNYLDIMNQLKSELNHKIYILETENTKLKNEKENMIQYYTSKIDFYKQTLVVDKNKISSTYDLIMNDMKNKYNQSKSAFQQILNEREKDLEKFLDSHKTEIEQLNKVIDKEKAKNEEMNQEHLKDLKIIQEHKSTIELLKIELEKLKKDYSFVVKERNQFEEKCDFLIKDNNNLKNLNDGLNRVTHGKFLKKEYRQSKTMVSNL